MPIPPSRPYVSPTRQAGAEARRVRTVQAAIEVLREKGAGGLSLEAVAKAAGVSRLTLYNQFGSRRGLLEAVFDDRARAGGLARLHEAIGAADPRQGLARLIEIFCGFWADSARSWRSLFGAAAGDEEFMQAILARNERRRGALAALVGKLGLEGERARDVTDTLFALTSFAFYDLMQAGGRDERAICALLQSTAEAIVDRALER
jgi:AcrR family transcriptional regulator